MAGTWKWTVLIPQIYFISNLTQVFLSFMLLDIFLLYITISFSIDEIKVINDVQLEGKRKNISNCWCKCAISTRKRCDFVHLQLFRFYFSQREIIHSPKKIFFFSEFSKIYLFKYCTNAILQVKTQHFSSSLELT